MRGLSSLLIAVALTSKAVAATVSSSTTTRLSSTTTTTTTRDTAVLWTCNGNAGGALWTLSVTDTSYSVTVNDQLWFPEGDTIVHSNGTWYSARGGSLVSTSASEEYTGTDPTLGAFSGYTQLWSTTPLSGNNNPIPVNATFKCYLDVALIGFELTFPEGAMSVNGSYVPGANQSITGSGDVVTEFPSFASSSSDPSSTTWWSQDAAFLRHGGIWTLFEWWGKGMDSLPYGSQNGPIYIFNSSFGPSSSSSPSHPTGSAILCPLTHFHLTPSGTFADHSNPVSPKGVRTSVGVASTVIDIPAGYTTNVGLYISGSGVTGTTYEWGSIMRQKYQTTRLIGDSSPRTALTEKISFWTDNGAVYFQSWWDRACPRDNCTLENSAQTLFIDLKNSFLAQKLPFGIIQVDTWWFYQGADVKGSNSGDIDCIDWKPRADMWPNGLPWLTQQAGGISMLLYSWGYVTPEAGNQMLNYTWETTVAYGGALEAQPMLNETYLFYSEIRDRFLSYNGTSFEEDNLNTMTMSYQSHITDVSGVETWWSGFASPFCESSIPVQICESSPADILESLKFGCVTNSRDNIDDVPQQSDPNFINRWHTGFDRMYLTALGIQPYFDNVWTMESQPGSTWEPLLEQYVELAFIISALSTGPVGVGDIVNNTNRTLVMTSCGEDGRLLKPSTPSIYFDFVYIPQSTGENPISNVALGRIFESASFIPTSSSSSRSSNTNNGVKKAAAAAGNQDGGVSVDWVITPAPHFSVLSVDVANTVTIHPADFWPDISEDGIEKRRPQEQQQQESATTTMVGSNVNGYVITPWNPGFAAMATACSNGNQGNQCVSQAFSSSSPYSVVTGVPANNQMHNWEFVSLSPVYTCDGFVGGYNGYSLIGELTKVVRASVVRFAWSEAGCTNGSSSSTSVIPMLRFAVVGAPNESIQVTVLAPTTTITSTTGIIWNVLVTIPATGQDFVVVTCSGTGDSSNPCTF